MYDYIHFDHDIKYKKYEKKSEKRRSKAWFFFFFFNFHMPKPILTPINSTTPIFSLSPIIYYIVTW